MVRQEGIGERMGTAERSDHRVSFMTSNRGCNRRRRHCANILTAKLLPTNSPGPEWRHGLLVSLGAAESFFPLGPLLMS